MYYLTYIHLCSFIFGFILVIFSYISSSFHVCNDDCCFVDLCFCCVDCLSVCVLVICQSVNTAGSDKTPAAALSASKHS